MPTLGPKCLCHSIIKCNSEIIPIIHVTPATNNVMCANQWASPPDMQTLANKEQFLTARTDEWHVLFQILRAKILYLENIP